MNRRTKWVLGVTVALITAASLRFTVGHRYWDHHRHRGHHYSSCEGRWRHHDDRSSEKRQAEPQTDQQPSTN